MALKVWMPLHGNIKNLGTVGDGLTVSTAVTYVDSGKTSQKAFSGGQVVMPASMTSSIFNNNAFSYACWIYINASTGSTGTPYQGIIFGNDGWSNASNNRKFSFWQHPTCNDFHWSWMNDVASTTFTGGIITGALPSYKWTHVAVTYQNPTGKIYINGELVQTFTGVSNSASFNYDTNILWNICATYRYQNDLRIYDSCLSAMEVREIAKGLTLHYKLDQCDNLLQLQPMNYSPGAYQAYQLQLIENLQSGQTYTFQFWDIDVAHSGKTENELGIAVYWGGGSVSLNVMNGTSYFTNGHADYLEFTTTITSTQANGTGATNPWLYIYNSIWDATGTKYMHIGKWQVTKGSTIRPWTRTITNDIIDSSGYNNNASSNGSPRVGNSVSTPRYTCSAWFDTGAHIATPVSAHTFLPKDAITVNIWCKTTDVSQRFLSCTEGGGWNFEIYSGVLSFPLYIVNDGYQRCSFTTPLSTMNDNQWHMYTATYNRSQIKVYFDGVLENTLNAPTGGNIYYQTYTPLCLGTEAYTTSTQISGTFVGALSDLRIYSTALLDTDIQQLYNTSMKVNKNGTISAYELNEINGNKIASNNMYAQSGATSSYDRTTDTWTLTIPNNTNADIWGLGLGLLSNTHDNRLYIPWNNSYRLTMEVYSPATLNLVMDYNNYAVDGSETNGNDNDNIENRWQGTVSIPANTWTKVGFATRNSNSTYNPNKTFLYDDSTFGIKNTSGSSLTYKIRNIRWYLRNDTNKVYKTGVIKNNQYIERDKASFNNREECLEANEFIER